MILARSRLLRHLRQLSEHINGRREHKCTLKMYRVSIPSDFFSLLHSYFLHCHFFLLLLVECNQSLRDEKWKMRMAEEEKCKKTILPRRRTQDENSLKNFFTINCKEFQSEAPQTFSLKLIVCDFSQQFEWIESLSRLRGQSTSHESFV